MHTNEIPVGSGKGRKLPALFSSCRQMLTNGCMCAFRSLSYVTTLACFAFVLLALIYYTVDVQKWWSGAPFLFPGETQHVSELLWVCDE